MCDFDWLMQYFVQYFTCMVIKNLAVSALKLQIGNAVYGISTFNRLIISYIALILGLEVYGFIVSH